MKRKGPRLTRAGLGHAVKPQTRTEREAREDAIDMDIANRVLREIKKNPRRLLGGARLARVWHKLKTQP